MYFDFFVILSALLFITKVECKSSLKIGFLMNNPATNANHIDYLNDFFGQVNSSTTLKYTVDIVNRTIDASGVGLKNILSDFEQDDVFNIFSLVKFRNYTEINDVLSKSGMTMWTIYPLPEIEVYSNIIFFGSIYKTLERLYVYANENRDCVIVYQKSHPYASAVKVMLEKFPIPPLSIIELPESVNISVINETLLELKNYPLYENIGFASIILVKNTILPDLVKVYYDNQFESQDNNGGFDIDVILEDDANLTELVTNDPEWKFIRFVLAYNDSNPLINKNLLNDEKNQVIVHKLFVLYKMFETGYYRSKTQEYPTLIYSLHDRNEDLDGTNKMTLTSYNVLLYPLFVNIHDSTEKDILLFDLKATYVEHMGRPELMKNVSSSLSKINYVHSIVLLHYLTGNNNYSEKSAVIAEMDQIRKSNEQGLLKITVYPIIIDYSKQSLDETMKILKYYYDKNLFNFIFTTLTIEDRIAFVQKLKSNNMENIQIMAERYSTGVECQEKIVYTGLPFTVKAKFLYVNHLRSSTAPVAIISSQLKYGEFTSNYLKKMLKENELNNIYEYKMKDDSIAEGYTAMSFVRMHLYISDKVESTGLLAGNVILCLESSYVKSILNAYKGLKLNSEKTYVLFVSEYDERNSYITIYYSFEPYLWERKTKSQSFVNTLSEMGSHKLNFVSSVEYTGFHSIKLWDKVIRNSMTLKFDLLIQQLFTARIDTINGPYSLSDSGYSYQYIVEGEKTGNGISYRNPVIESKANLQSYYFNNNTGEMCDYNNYVIGGSLYTASRKEYYVVILVPMSGFDSIEATDIVNNIYYSIDLINTFGGVGNGILSPLLPRYDKNIAEIEKTLINDCKKENVIAFMGLLKKEEVEYFNPILKQYDKLLILFYTYEGDTCESNVMVISFFI